MYCKEVNELFSDYFDDVIDEKIKSIFEEHLSVCEKCRKNYNDYKIIFDSIRRLAKGSIVLGDDFAEAIINKIKIIQKTKKNKSYERIKNIFSPTFIGGIAAASVLFLLGNNIGKMLDSRYLTPNNSTYIYDNSSIKKTYVNDDNKKEAKDDIYEDAKEGFKVDSKYIARDNKDLKKVHIDSSENIRYKVVDNVVPVKGKYR